MPNGHPNKILPPVEILRECFDYDPVCGTLRWKARPKTHFKNAQAWKAWNIKYAGNVAGGHDEGYCKVAIACSGYLAHRIIWKLMTGEEPPETIDHKDRNKANDRWDNLRAATVPEQHWNVGLIKSNTSGYRGVSLERTGRWRASIKVHGAQRHLGTFDTAKEASLAYDTAARENHGKFYLGA